MCSGCSPPHPLLFASQSHPLTSNSLPSVCFRLVLWYTEFDHDCQYHYRFQTIQGKPVSQLGIHNEDSVGPPSLFTSSQKSCSLECAPMISSLVMLTCERHILPVQASVCHHMGIGSHDCDGHDTSSTQHFAALLTTFTLYILFDFYSMLFHDP